MSPTAELLTDLQGRLARAVAERDALAARVAQLSFPGGKLHDHRWTGNAALILPLLDRLADASAATLRHVGSVA